MGRPSFLVTTSPPFPAEPFHHSAAQCASIHQSPLSLKMIIIINKTMNLIYGTLHAHSCQSASLIKLIQTSKWK